jgi:hypothetical protein
VSGRVALTCVALALAATGCCGLAEILDEASDRDPPPNAPASELGTAVFPAGASTARATKHTWYATRLKPRTYRVRYALASSEASAVARDHRRYAQKVGYQKDSNGRFRWRPPAGCTGNMGCVYEAVAKRSIPDIEPLVARFRARAKAGKLSSLDAAQLVVTFVQAIPYEIPQQEPFGVLPPALVVSRRKGDCDSKSLLAHLMLRELGIESVMVASDAHHHGMLAIALPVPGTTITHRGRRYAFTEMTAKGSPIGHINPRLLSPNDWKVQPVRLPRRR